MDPVIEALADLLRSPDAEVRLRGARALEVLGDVEAIPALAHALNSLDSEDGAVREVAARALPRLWGAASDAQRSFLGCVVLAGPGLRAEGASLEGAIQALGAALSSGDARARARAVIALEALGDAGAIPTVIHALRDADAGVRCAAARGIVALCKSNPEAQRGARSVLRRALHDRHAAVRRAARDGLIALGAIAPARRDEALAAAEAAREGLRERLRAATVDEAADLLFERGRALAGRPLERAEWREIAGALRTARGRERLLDFVTAATRSEQARRALRLARAAARPARRARAGVFARPATTERIIEQADRESYDVYDDADSCTCPACAPASSDEWRAYVRPEELRVPGILPVNAVQEMVSAHLGRMDAQAAHSTSLWARLGDAQRAKLLEVFAAPPPVPEEVAGLLSHHGLEWLAGPPGAAPGPATIRTGPELAAVALLEEHALPLPALEIDWPSVSAWLAGRLVQPPAPDPWERTAVALAFFRYVTTAPHEAMTELRAAIARAHAGWLPLVPWLHVRGCGAEGRALVEASIGSALVLHLLQRNLEDVHARRAPELGASGAALRELLSNGGGTLRRMDYPAFRVVSRPAVSLVRPETVAALREMTGEIGAAHAAVMTSGCREVLSDLLQRGGYGAYAGLPEPLQREIARAIEEHAIAFVVLDNVVFASSPDPVRVRRRHVRRFWTTPRGPGEAPPPDLPALREQFDPDRVKEGLVHALLDQLHAPWVEAPGLHAALKEGWIWLARTIAMTYAIPPIEAGAPDEEPVAVAHRLANHLVQQVVHAPLELVQALGMTHDQGLPRLQGGQATALERRFRQVLCEASGSPVAPGEAAVAPAVFTCRPISKRAALDRGELGRDCSTASVPLRALSPHHVYYGVFEGEAQLPGYMTVYEAWAEADGGRLPVLCLETINVPIDRFDPIQQDLVLLFDAIARSRGLHPEVALITGIGTWNYRNEFLLANGRRFRKGEPVRLHPADPVSWRLYELTTDEAWYYSAFEATQARRGGIRVLAPFDPDLDPVQPENLEEARRLAALPPRQLKLTARTAEGPIGFISAWPELL